MKIGVSYPTTEVAGGPDQELGWPNLFGPNLNSEKVLSGTSPILVGKDTLPCWSNSRATSRNKDAWHFTHL